MRGARREGEIPGRRIQDHAPKDQDPGRKHEEGDFNNDKYFDDYNKALATRWGILPKTPDGIL